MRPSINDCREIDTSIMFLPVVLLSLTATLGSAAYIDLTHPINANTLYWFKDKFELTPLVRLTDPHWVATNKLSTAEHGGTHIDAPYHFNKDGWKLGQVPLNRLFMVEGELEVIWPRRAYWFSVIIKCVHVLPVTVLLKQSEDFMGYVMPLA